ncbi:MAG TPA: FAD-dependent oxidoreductase [Xanthomonadales bacterium]|nr:FAD-dependent oxidoreductase [Xanthomonadales bacterium]
MNATPNVDFDVIIVGSGPAGVSAAFPLLEAGLRVLMVDGGQGAAVAPPAGQFLDLRHHSADQWLWMAGRDYHALRQADAVSPKLRVPTHATVFAGFLEANRITADDFLATGSLAPGGLSNSWGCGVACLDDDELAAFPFAPAELRASYGTVAQRIGVSGGRDDDLSQFFGLDDWCQPAVPMDELQGDLLARYSHHRNAMLQRGFRLGRARVAVITEPVADRKACDQSGTCLWGCSRRALYSATEDLRLLGGYPGFSYRPGFLVERVGNEGAVIVAEGRDSNGHCMAQARRLLLAAGTLASTRLALQALNHRVPVSMQSCPTAAFMLWLPRHLGRAHSAAFGLGQLAFALDLGEGTTGFGSLFNTTGIPVTEFVRQMPFGKRYGTDLLALLLSSCVVGNVFLPGSMTDVTLGLDAHDGLSVKGNYRQEVDSLMQQAQRRLRASFRRLGAEMVPTSFKVGRPGSDIHYAASLPMREHPEPGQTDRNGELFGATGIHVVDGASLSTLTAKSHTLTIMANADRIARNVAQTLVETR